MIRTELGDTVGAVADMRSIVALDAADSSTGAAVHLVLTIDEALELAQELTGAARAAV